MASKTIPAAFRDEFDLRRRRLLDQLDELLAFRLHGRLGAERRDELVDEIGGLVELSDDDLLRAIAKGAP
jgi:hypothetical protein